MASSDNKHYVVRHLDGSIHIFVNEKDLWSWDTILHDFKPWYTYKNKILYRTNTVWIVKINAISSAVKFKKLRDALKELFYFTDILKLKNNGK
jgi:hypothetical protein